MASDSGGLESTVAGVRAGCRHGRRSRELQDLISTTSRKQRVNGRWGEATSISKLTLSDMLPSASLHHLSLPK